MYDRTINIFIMNYILMDYQTLINFTQIISFVVSLVAVTASLVNWMKNQQLKLQRWMDERQDEIKELIKAQTVFASQIKELVDTQTRIMITMDGQYKELKGKIENTLEIINLTTNNLNGILNDVKSRVTRIENILLDVEKNTRS